ncbi:PadR family transcriptional regulator [Halohasta litorea]|uniref:PadR family transcriptional regulator n=1 Tax=Halohasta litorea TaxID=869891 RepID=A0ABD6DCF5_9EURY|nr:PadR family transcriptional regulator [Halohasta litorea]
MFELTGFQRDLLYCIAGTDDPSGQEVRSELNQSSSVEVNHGRLYPNLDDLVDQGLVEKQSKNKRTNLYRLTDQGRNLIADRRQWEDERLEQLSLDA